MEPTPLHERLAAIAGSLTYRDLAERTDTHPETVRRYMQGQSPSVEFLSTLCAQLGINGEWLLTGRGPMRIRDIRPAALREANASELLSAMAETLERLRERVERLEVFVHTMETRLRAAATGAGTGAGVASAAEVKLGGGGTGDIHDQSAARQAAGARGVGGRAAGIADALPKPARPHDR